MDVLPSRRLPAVLLVLSAMPLLAQTARESITVNLVEVPVNVVGRDGNPMRGLTKANFELYDGRTPVTVSSFDTIDFASPESLTVQARNPAASRSFLLLFDLGFSSPRGLDRARVAARDFVAKNVSKHDLVGVATIDVSRGYRIIANFTTDRAAVVEAISRPITYRAADPLQLAGEQPLVDSGEGRGRGAEAVAQAEAIAAYKKQVYDQASREQIIQQLGWLGKLSASLRGLRGRKQVIFLSEGFDATLVKGSSARDVAATTKWAEAVITGSWWKVGSGKEGNIDSDPQFGNSGSLAVLQAMAKAFQGSDVMLHAVDVQGVRIEGDRSRGAKANTTDALHLLADPTGGTVFENSNSLTDNFARMLRQQEVVYVLGFQAPIKTPGKMHSLKVKLVGVPSGASVHHRQAYFEGGTRTTNLERSLSTAEIITKDIPQNDVRIAALTTAFPLTGNGRAQVPVVVEINGQDILADGQGTALTGEMFVYAFDENGAVADRIYDRVAIDTVAAGEQLRLGGIKYIATLVLPPGRYAVKSLFRIGTNDRTGFARNDVVVGRFGDAAVMPFVLDDPQSWLLIKGSDHSGAPYPFHVSGQPFIPSVSGRVPAAAVRKLAVFVWSASAEELTWETTPPSSLLAQVRSPEATKLVLQVDGNPTAESFGVTVHRGSQVLTGSAPIH